MPETTQPSCQRKASTHALVATVSSTLRRAAWWTLAFTLCVPGTARPSLLEVTGDAERSGASSECPGVGCGVRLRLSSCGGPDHLVLPTGILTAPEYQACQSIESSASRVESADRVVLRSGRHTALESGFSVASGGELIVDVDPNLTGDAYLQEELATAATQYSSRFHVNLDQLALPEGDRLEHLVGVDRREQTQFRLALSYNANLDENRLISEVKNDDGGWLSTEGLNELVILPGWHQIDVEWKAADDPATPNGYLSACIDDDGSGTSCVRLPDPIDGELDNDQASIVAVRWGVTGLNSTTGGSLDMDDFSSFASGTPHLQDDFDSGDVMQWGGKIPPAARFAFTPGAEPGVIALDASQSYDPDGGGLLYQWRFGDGATGTGVQAEHTYPRPGLYLASLRVTDNDGLWNESSAIVDPPTDNHRPEPSFSPVRATGPAPLSLFLDASNSTDSDGTIIRFDWDLGDGTAATGARIGHTYADAGTYDVLLTVEDDGGLVESVSGEIIVEQPNERPVVSVSTTALEGDAPLTVDFDASESSDPDGTSLSFAWDLGDGAQATGAALTHTFDEPGDHMVRLMVTDEREAEARARLLVRALPATVSLVNSSPYPLEGGVAQTRETKLVFDGPLDPSSVTEAAVRASFGGSELSLRRHVAPDGRTLTLFYDDLLPANARVRVTVDGSMLQDVRGRTVDANGNGTGGGIAVIDFDTLGVATLPDTSVCGSIFASEPALTPEGGPTDEPLAGVTISVDGQADSLRTTTAADGSFCLDPAPSGRFFVHIDGSTAIADIPAGAYYPTVGKAWQSTAGEQTDIGNLFLPLIPADALQGVSQTEDTPVSLPADVVADHPELAGTRIMVPADALYANDGSRGGMVGLAPVAPDRLPGELPEGLDLPLVVTVQTDGATNFDQPAPVCFPNLPSASNGGRPLEPGAKSALWSFNHDKGEFEVSGAMTVSDDGTVICTDPGSGVQAPGWHGSQPGTGGDAPPPLGGPDADGGDGGSGSGSGGGPGDGADGGTPEDPTDDEPEDPCASEGGSTWDKSRDVARAARDVLDCADGLFKVSKTFKCLDDVGFATFEVFASSSDLVSTLNETPTAGGAVSASVSFLKNQKNSFSSIYKCGADLTAGRFRTLLLDCPSSLTNVLDTACNFASGGSSDCLESDLARSACSRIDTAKRGFDAGKSLADTAEAVVTGNVMQTACSIVDDLDTTLRGFFLSNLSAEGSRAINTLQAQMATYEMADDRPLTEAERLQLLDLTDTLLEELDVPINDAADGQSFVDHLEEYQTQLLAANSLLSRDLLDQGVPKAGRHLYLLQLPNLVRRGETEPSGGARFQLPPETEYRYALYDPQSNRFGESVGRTAANGERTRMAAVVLEDASSLPDADGDGLPDVAEQVAGTDLQKTDSDGDGVGDRAELEQGTNPTDGLAVSTGITATLDTPGTAIDLCALNDFVALADSDAGVALVEAPQGRDPTLVAQVDTPGQATAVACGGNRLLVADGTAGVALVDVADPPAGFLVRQISRENLGGTPLAVASDGGIGYVGSDGGTLVALDMPTGSVLSRIDTGDQEVQDLKLSGDALYVLTETHLRVYETTPNFLAELGSVPVAGRPSPLESGRKLFVGSGLAYVGHFDGYSVVDVSDLAAPVVVGVPAETQAAVHELAANGSGLLVATTSFSGAGTLALSLYDASRPDDVTRFLGSFDTPGEARGVALYDGRAYVADTGAGLQVVNYLPYDNLGVAPGLSLSASFDLAGGTAEEGKLARITAHVQDDVQVRNVDFFVDGRRVRRDGGFPFEYRFLTPSLVDRSDFRVQIRATDTGGNSTWSDEIVVTITPDATAPQITQTIPVDGSTPERVEAVTAFFDEPLDPATIDGTALQVHHGGPDGELGTADDRLVAGAVSTHPQLGSLVLTFDRALPPTQYRAEVSASVADAGGNALGSPVAWSFQVPGVPDRDGDGIPDELEPPLGLDPDLPDSDGDGVPDGLEDSDDDGLLNADEVHLGTDPGDADTDGDGISDGDEVAEGSDPLTREIAIGDTVSADIQRSYEIDRFTFVAAAGEKVFLDVQAAASSLGLVLIELNAPSGDQLYSYAIRGGDAGTLTLNETGTYTIRVGSNSDDGTGTYRFQLWDVPPADVFDVSVGDAVSDGVPGAGAGRIETPGAHDEYRFTATQGDKIFLDVQTADGTLDLIRLDLDAPDGSNLYGYAIRGGDPGTFSLPSTGTYTIRVGRNDEDGTGTYSFQIWNVPAPDTFDIVVGDSVSDGVPGPGAGRIETPGAHDEYRFTANQEDRIFLDVQAADGTLDLVSIDLSAPDGSSLYGYAIRGGDPGTFVLPATGTYTIRVGRNDEDGTGAYSFQIWNVPAPDTFDIAVGDSVSDGVPGAGAGRIETPGTHDEYRFDAIQGDQVFLELLGGDSSLDSVKIRLLAPDGSTLVDEIARGRASNSVLLPDTGTYVVRVGSTSDDGIGAYGFTLWSVPPPDTFDIVIGDTVADGVPGAGAGNIETPGAHDEYRFDANQGDQVVVDLRGGDSSLAGIRLGLYAPDETRLVYEVVRGTGSYGATLPETGTYVIRVGSTRDEGTGAYSFQLLSGASP